MRGRRRRSGPAPEDSPTIPPGTDLLALAHEVAEQLRAAAPWEPTHGALESIAVVHITVGQHMGQDPEPGICMTWTQGEAGFGLVMPITRLVSEAGSVESAPFYLRLAIDEPHEGTSDGSRWWFLDLPSGPY